MIKNYLVLLLCGIISIVGMSGCSDDEEFLPDTDEVVDISGDILQGKIFYYASLKDLMNRRCILATTEPVVLRSHNAGQLQLSVTEINGHQYIKATSPDTDQASLAKRVVIPAYVEGVESGRIRNLIFILNNDTGQSDLSEGEDTYAAEDTEDKTNDELFKIYGKFVGKGTECYGYFGNLTREILISDQIMHTSKPTLFTHNENMTDVELTQIHETSFSNLMKSVGASVGLAGKHKGVGVGFNYGYESVKRETNDFEYMMYNYKVKRAEMKINLPDLEAMTNNDRDAAEFLGYIADQFNIDVLEKLNKEFDPNYVYAEYGTDVITQGTVGGTYSMVYSREENIHESKIQHDISFYAQYKKEEDTTGWQWYQHLKEKSSDPDLKAEVKVSYQNNEYFKSTKAQRNTVSRGGAATINDPAKWVEAFNDKGSCDQWQLIQYNLKSDGGPEAIKDKWMLYNIDKMADNVINALDHIFTFYGKKSEYDQRVLNNAKANIEVLKEKREEYLDSQVIKDPEKSPLVICDVMMKNCPERRSGDTPEPFMAPDPLIPSVMRTYYPLITNNFFDPAKGSKKMRGMPIDTNDNVFVAANHNSSHYWYVALAHAGDCHGITDIEFYTTGEAPEGYVKRGSHARSGLGGLLVKERYVHVKYGREPNSQGYDRSKLITAIGLWDTHEDCQEVYPNDHTYRIFASSFGADIPPIHTKDHIDAFHSFWWQLYTVGKNKFYTGGWAVTPHTFKVVYSRTPLPLTDISKESRSFPKWGGDTYFEDDEE